MHELIIRSRAPLGGGSTVDDLDIKRRQGRGRVGQAEGRVVVLREMTLVRRRIGGQDRIPDDIPVVEIHPEHAHVAAGVELEQVALREVVAVLHHGGAGHVLILAVLYGHITDRATTEDREIALPDTAGIVQREVKMATEDNDLRVLLQNRCQCVRRPVVRQG